MREDADRRCGKMRDRKMRDEDAGQKMRDEDAGQKMRDEDAGRCGKMRDGRCGRCGTDEITPK
jgi:hypothetical protein